MCVRGMRVIEREINPLEQTLDVVRCQQGQVGSDWIVALELVSTTQVPEGEIAVFGSSKLYLQPPFRSR